MYPLRSLNVPQFGKPWINNFEESGPALKKKPTGRPRSSRNPQNIDVERESVLQNPRRSIRKQAAAVEMSLESVRKILTLYLKFYLYKLQIVQQRRENNYQLRLEFCQKFTLFQLRRCSDQCKNHNSRFQESIL